MIQNVDSTGSSFFGNGFDTLPAYVFVERQGRIIYANLAARQVLGAQPEETLDRPTGEIFWELVPSTSENVKLMSISDNTQGFESRIRGAEDRVIPVRGVCNLSDPVNRETIIIAVPSPTLNTSSNNFLGEVLSSAPEAVAITRDSLILHINPEFTRLFGYSSEEAIGKDIDRLVLPEHCRQEREELYTVANMRGRASIETVRKTRNGELIDVALLVSTVVVNGVPVGYYASYRDIRDRKQREAKLEHDALHDGLTGLANRMLFLDRLQVAIACCSQGELKQIQKSSTQRPNCQTGVLAKKNPTERLLSGDTYSGLALSNFAVMFLDLDKFKDVNDTLGHATGDEVLKTVAQRLRSCFRPQDTIARFGGDEFAILIENISNAVDVRRIAGRLERELAQPMHLDGHNFNLSASIGIVFGSTEHEFPEQVLRDADYAMYRAKSLGGSRYEIFDNFMQVHATTQQQKEQELRLAIEKREFEVWYQPVYLLKDGSIEGFEALLRWHRPDGSCVSFLELLPVAEETGLMIPIGREVIERACLQLHTWIKAHEQPITMSVNISARQFIQPDLRDKISLILDQTGIPASGLRLEIPENALNQNPDVAATILQQFADRGIQLVLDNFGSDLAAVKHLLELPIDMVKLDRRLISRLPSCDRHAAFLEGLFQLGRSLKVKMLAEGIETMEQFELLRSFGCELAQGHLFAEPVNGERATLLLQQGRWPSVLNA